MISRRDVMLTALSASLAGTAYGAEAKDTAPIETTSGKVRGKRSEGISRFHGIPYGTDTAKHRFQPAKAAPGWTGVRDCFAFGPQAPQMPFLSAAPSTTSEVGRALASIFGSGNGDAAQGEDCLVLNVFTPDASSRRKRPVMVWLHGGGFTSGSAGVAQYDGGALGRRGDVVVVTINHRLNAMGYLYLGALHDDFADSGNVGQLDIVLALQWVRDNIAAFGGDPGSVTIFGESGGGSKVSVLLAMPPAKGLFHKAIIQSGPGVRMTEKAAAVEATERTLAALGVAKADVQKLQTLEPLAIIKAAAASRTGGPVVDGRSLPTHPFHPTATDVSRDVPVIVGSNKDESTLFMGLEPNFGSWTEDEVRKRFETTLGARAGAAFDFYRNMRPNDPPTYWATSMSTDMGTWMNSIRLAERKAAQQAAPAFMYRLDWESPAAGGALRSPHGLDVALCFDNVNIETQSAMLGAGPEPKKLGAEMSQAWINFARTGDPSQKGLAWPRYDATGRDTMIFDRSSRAVSDPDRGKREFWTA